MSALGQKRTLWSNNALLFDEAEALLGKRPDASHARDRYANMEISPLLTVFEGHIGTAILTANLRSDFDCALLRRFHVVVDFPKPDVEARRVLIGISASETERVAGKLSESSGNNSG